MNLRGFWAALSAAGLFAGAGTAEAARDGRGGGFNGGIRQAGCAMPRPSQDGGRGGPGGRVGCKPQGNVQNKGPGRPGGQVGCHLPVAPKPDGRGGNFGKGCVQIARCDKDRGGRPGQNVGGKPNNGKKGGGQNFCNLKDRPPPPVKDRGKVERGCRQVAQCHQKDGGPGKKPQPGQCVGQRPDKPKGNNGVGNGVDPQPPGNPPINDGPGARPGQPGNRGGGPSVPPGLAKKAAAGAMVGKPKKK